ncbi:g5235 [Coccomyxa elongata]
MEPLQSLSGSIDALSTTDEGCDIKWRKVGRPIIYTGNMGDPGLTSAERRAMRRRIANRESARRVRVRRQELGDQMSSRVRTLEDVNTKLLSENEKLQSALMQLKREYKEAQAERPPQSHALTSVSMQQNNIFTNTDNFIGTTTAGQGYQSTAPANMDDYFVLDRQMAPVACASAIGSGKDDWTPSMFAAINAIRQFAVTALCCATLSAMRTSDISPMRLEKIYLTD